MIFYHFAVNDTPDHYSWHNNGFSRWRDTIKFAKVSPLSDPASDDPIFLSNLVFHSKGDIGKSSPCVCHILFRTFCAYFNAVECKVRREDHTSYGHVSFVPPFCKPVSC